jgi:hypothetical protein
MFGTFGMSKAQSITIDAPSTVYSNTLVSISLNTSCAVSSVNWDLQGGTIVNSYSNGATIEVRFANTGYKYIQATAIISCSPTYQQQILNTSANINVINPANIILTISGRVTQCNNLGVSFANITRAKGIDGNPITIITDSDGNYSFKTAMGTSLSLSATLDTQPNRSFTTIDLPDITANKTANISKIINYSVPTITTTTFQPCTINAPYCILVSGFVIGESYYMKRRIIGHPNSSSLTLFIATQETYIYECCIDQSVSCYYWACGSPCSL